MKKTNHHTLRRVATVLAAGLTLGGIIGTASAQMYRMQTLGSGGGVPAQAVQNSPVINGTNCTLSWYGTMGWYTIQGATSPSGPWNNLNTVEATGYAWQTTLPYPATTNSYTFFQLSQANAYAGSTACGGCHGDHYTPWTATAHARAYNDLVNIGRQNSSCILCHTVGFGQPTGFDSNSPVASLEGVGCEDCHGPAGWHKNSDHAVILPAMSIDPAICGSCHSGHNPQYNEFTNSPHYLAISHTVSSMSSVASCGVCHSGAGRMAMLTDYANRQNGQTNAMVMPALADAQTWGPTCAVCHDPHGLTPSPVFGYATNVVAGVTNVAWTKVRDNYVQMRNPLWSSNFYTMVPQADARRDSSGNVYYMNTTFASMYDPTVNVCGQCHNTRGYRWDGRSYGLMTNIVAMTNLVISAAYTNTYTTNYNQYGQIIGILTNSYPTGGTTTNTVVTNMLAVTTGLTTNIAGFSRPPHLSPQYNMLIGILQPDYLNSTNGSTVYTNGILNNGVGIYATHSGIIPRSPYNTNQCATCHVPSYAGPNGNVSGHTFEIDPNGCALGGCHTSTKYGIGAPDYIDFAIENSNLVVSVADLLNTWATNAGPALFTNYNRYQQNSWEYTLPGALASITNSGPSSADQLLLPDIIKQARYNIYMVASDGTFGTHNPKFIPLLIKDAEAKVLSQMAVQFTANEASADPGATIMFTNLTPSIGSPVWDFGDGGTASTTAAVVSHTYTNAGAYTVSLTDGANSLTRNSYINIYPLPTPSYTCSTPTNHPALVTFTNTSVNANYGRWAFYSGAVSTANVVGGKASPLDVPEFFTFTNAGSYSVVFYASSPGGTVAVTNTLVVP